MEKRYDFADIMAFLILSALFLTLGWQLATSHFDRHYNQQLFEYRNEFKQLERIVKKSYAQDIDDKAKIQLLENKLELHRHKFLWLLPLRGGIAITD